MNDKLINIMINGLAIISLLAGLFGMLFCFPFLWSSRMGDLVGGGLAFVGGSVLFGTGLITLGLFNRQANNNT